MGFLDKFISVDKTEEMETPDEKPVSKLKSGGRGPSIAQAPASSLTLPLTSPSTVINPQIVETLEKAVIESTPAEYVQFRAFVESLASLPEDMRYTTALNVAAAAKLTGVIILRAMDARISRLDTEKTTFEKWAMQEFAVQVTNRESEAERRTVKISELANQIEVLTSELNTLKLNASQEKDRLESSAESFMAAHDKVLASLKAERDKVASLVTPTN